MVYDILPYYALLYDTILYSQHPYGEVVFGGPTNLPQSDVGNHSSPYTVGLLAGGLVSVRAPSWGHGMGMYVYMYVQYNIAYIDR